ncbi:Protein CBG27488 [Caenorhabditis briggsae]|uniref:Protein CBG27488 n=2 Tax=Caenorhabditis briggsae TaxID=6238 RepID=B6IF03_CAEBR|nr:Protein CBG27488 [Caenorhabditis briggsae]ULT80521.1 hypothetical protein L3Y34_010826 [Caenorhabditis briggsae]CAR98483.1 Protein CBG27488 [Caenorhabditis briggsae]
MTDPIHDQLHLVLPPNQGPEQNTRQPPKLNEIADDALKVICQYLTVSDMKALRQTDHRLKDYVDKNHVLLSRVRTRAGYTWRDMEVYNPKLNFIGFYRYSFIASENQAPYETSGNEKIFYNNIVPTKEKMASVFSSFLVNEILKKNTKVRLLDMHAEASDNLLFYEELSKYKNHRKLQIEKIDVELHEASHAKILLDVIQPGILTSLVIQNVYDMKIFDGTTLFSHLPHLKKLETMGVEFSMAISEFSHIGTVQVVVSRITEKDMGEYRSNLLEASNFSRHEFRVRNDRHLSKPSMIPYQFTLDDWIPEGRFSISNGSAVDYKIYEDRIIFEKFTPTVPDV